MSIVSLSFLLFLFLSALLYYIFPKKYRWIILLVSSIFFFLNACSYYLILYLLSGIVVTYAGTRLMKSKINKKVILILTLLLLVFPLFLLKYYNIIPMTFGLFNRLFDLNLTFTKINLLAPLGISYYTLSLISYVVDVYWGTCESEKNIFKHALFACYYPVMISGPIIRYPDMKEELFKPKKFEWNNIFYGFTRIMYGLMKKLIIADTLATIVATIFADYKLYSGFYIIYGLICYAIQIYTDFSGCMDIVIGASKIYGVKLPENFDSPFFSKSLSEFWRRWHMSLGAWAKDYILYSLLKSNLFQKIGKFTRKKLGKKIGKKIPTILAIFILWLLIGIWHGTSYQYIFAAGILPWVYLTVGELFEGVPEKINQLLKINTQCFSYRLFQSIKVFFLMCFVWLFVCAPTLRGSLSVIKYIFILPQAKLILTIPSAIILFLLIVITFIDYLKYKEINVIEKFYSQNLLFRLIVVISLIILILVYGYYGPGYNPADFIYGGF